MATLTFVEHRPQDVEADVLLLGGGPMVERFEAIDVRPIVAGMPGRPSRREAVAFHRALVGHLRRTAPDVIIARGLKPTMLAAPAARHTATPLLWCKVDFSRDARLAAPVALAAHAVLPNSQAVGAAVPARRVIGHLPPPVRLADAFRVSARRPAATIGSIGRLIPYKGHHHVIEAAALLSSRFPEVRVIIAGPPAPEAPDYPVRLRRLAESLGISDRVDVPGAGDVEPILDRLTVSVTATYRDDCGFGREGFGMAIAEASWAGLPVVVTRGGGSVEALVDGVTGSLANAADPADLARAVALYLSDPARANEAGRAGAAFARERFAPAHLARRLCAYAEQVAGRHPTA